MAENPDCQHAWVEKDDIERFFESEWFDFLCDINPDFTKIHLQEARA